MAIDAYAALKEFIAKLLGDRDTAAEYAQDPDGVLAAHGLTDADLSGVDIRQVVADAASEVPLADGTRSALQNYSSGGPAPSGYPSVPAAQSAHPQPAELVQHLNYVTYATYEGDEHITQQLINYQDYSTTIDNSVDVEVDGDFHGDLEIETTNVNATGDGAVAAGDDVENAATGDGSQIIDGDNVGQANTGDGAVQAFGDIEAPVNTGVNTGVIADGDVTNAVVGDDNQVANVDGEADNSVFNFGDGDVTNFGEAEFDDTAVAVGGGDANNVSDNHLEGGAAAAAGGDAEGYYEETFEETDVEAYSSVVSTEQGPGDQEVEVDVEAEIDGPGVPAL